MADAYARLQINLQAQTTLAVGLFVMGVMVVASLAVVGAIATTASACVTWAILGLSAKRHRDAPVDS